MNIASRDPVSLSIIFALGYWQMEIEENPVLTIPISAIIGT
jgi:hypothetical protein